jgi:CRISPR-associated protein Csm3
MLMSQTSPALELRGRIVISGTIIARTGLRIGSSDKNIGIGEAAQVLRDALTNRPYIPGSSLRGKLRSLAERSRWDRLRSSTQNIGPRVAIHRCTNADDYAKCEICPVFGVTSDNAFATPTRLIVRDLHLSDTSARALDRARTELPYTEIKTEVAIDRITAASNPREIERVPAGAEFDGLNLSFGVYSEADVRRFGVVAHAMALLEDDYLGGHGARGYGRIEFRGLTITERDYRGNTVTERAPRKFGSALALAGDVNNVGTGIREALFGTGTR